MELIEPGISLSAFLLDAGLFIGPIVAALLGASLAIDVIRWGIAWARFAFKSPG